MLSESVELWAWMGPCYLKICALVLHVLVILVLHVLTGICDNLYARD
jgi:hypothetical protein